MIYCYMNQRWFKLFIIEEVVVVVLQDESGAVENVDMNSMLVVVPYETGGAGYQSPCMNIFPTGHYSILP